MDQTMPKLNLEQMSRFNCDQIMSRFNFDQIIFGFIYFELNYVLVLMNKL